tara:strand:+ start:460 stop:663 length:204 start_codon:yes stop_codon:yes gene_type:complete
MSFLHLKFPNGILIALVLLLSTDFAFGQNRWSTKVKSIRYTSVACELGKADKSESNQQNPKRENCFH